MYTIKNFTYAEAGKYLHGSKAKGLCAPTEFGPYTESDINIDNIDMTDDYIAFDNIRWENPGIRCYADAKKFIIGKRYSNDAQIAIMLNKDDSEEDELAYEKMQEWRSWASILAKKIMETINKE